MSIHKKAQTSRDGLINKTYRNYRAIPAEYHGLSNPIPTEKQIIDSFWLSLEFFKERERWHQETARWYFNYMREMEVKAGKHLDLAEIMHVNYSHYLDLIGLAVLKGGSGRYAR